MMDGKLPWTEGGLELLQSIMQIVDRNGGYTNMADMVITECPEFFSDQEFNTSRKRLRTNGVATYIVDKIAIAKITQRIKKWQPWTPVDDKFILDEYGRLSLPEIAAALKRTDNAVLNRIWRLNSRKSA